MARSSLRALVNGTRQVLAVQVFTSVLAIALAGWTIAVTSEVMKERDRLRERVVQLEGELGARGIVSPPVAAVVSDQSAGSSLYPPEAGLTGAADPSFPERIIQDLFAPAPALRTIVLHVRSEADAETARAVFEGVQSEDLSVVINVLPARAGRPSGYYYYDGRQSRAAAALIGRFNDAARRAEIAQWSAQLRGQALPEQGVFDAARLDVVLPALPASPPAAATAP